MFPLVSIVIPINNRITFLRQSLRSVLGQTYQNIEVIVVDDGSKIDHAPTVADISPRVKYLRKENGGVASARNHGIAHASGDYFLFLDEDDFLEPDAVEALLGEIFTSPGYLWAAGRFRYVDILGHPLAKTHDYCFSTGDVYERFVLDNPIGAPSTVIVAASVLRAAGGFDEDLSMTDDWDLWITLARSHPIVRVNGVVSNYRLHADQESGKWSKHFEAHLRMLAKQRLNARPGSSELFDKSASKIRLEFGDCLYVAGQHARARYEWRYVSLEAGVISRAGLRGRLLKSYVPAVILSLIRRVKRTYWGARSRLSRHNSSGVAVRSNWK
jgi:glycosyltransferase involved in cell wall biosynthesis